LRAGADLVERDVEPFLTPAGDEHQCTRCGEPLGGGKSDAGGTAGDDGGLVAQPIARCYSYLLLTDALGVIHAARRIHRAP
jgi:hypothetical protein